MANLNNTEGSRPSPRRSSAKDQKQDQQSTSGNGNDKNDDLKIDNNPKFVFGGHLGVTSMMLGFPLLMWFMWLGAAHYGGGIPWEPEMSWLQYIHHLVSLVYQNAFPTGKAWLIYWTFVLAQAFMYVNLPGGVYAKGKPLPHENGRQVVYYCNGVQAFYASIAITFALHATGIFPLYTLIDELGPLLSVSIFSGTLVAVIAYVSAIWRGKQHRMTGHLLYDFFMGAELNPRFGAWLDFKMFFMVRLPWFMLFFLSAAAAAKQYNQNGTVSPEVLFILMAHFLYANACCKGEEMIIVTWDIFHEKWGFMLIFWNMSGVPLSYCHCTLFLAYHDPATYKMSRAGLVALYASYMFVYWVWDTSMSQRTYFRAQERGSAQIRHTFPQLPWRHVKNPQKITTSAGDSLLVDGWCKYARRIPYTCDVFFAVAWALVTGFASPWPWFYPVFFTVMIVHRAYRDIERCRAKYGKDWEEYERRVPYLLIPVRWSRGCYCEYCDFADHKTVCHLNRNATVVWIGRLGRCGRRMDSETAGRFVWQDVTASRSSADQY